MSATISTETAAATDARLFRNQLKAVAFRKSRCSEALICRIFNLLRRFLARSISAKASSIPLDPICRVYFGRFDLAVDFLPEALFFVAPDGRGLRFLGAPFGL